MHKSPVVHFEMPAKDNARVAKFYGDTFGWDMVITGPEMQNYVLAGTTDTDENRMVKTARKHKGYWIILVTFYHYYAFLALDKKWKNVFDKRDYSTYNFVGLCSV